MWAEWNGVRLAGLIAAFGMAFACGHVAAAAENVQEYELTTVTKFDVTLPDGRPQQTRSDVVIRYAWEVRGNEATLVLHSLSEKQFVDGRQVSRTLSTREAVETVNPAGQSVKVFFRDCSPSLQQVMTETFETPLVRLTRDVQGNLKKTVIDKDGSRETIQKGYVAPALLLQSPFPDARKPTWEADAELGFANVGFAAGKLKYALPGKGDAAKPDMPKSRTPERIIQPTAAEGPAAPSSVVDANGKKNQSAKPITVKVTGALRNDKGAIDHQAGTRTYDVRYDVAGEQVYSPTARRWVSGRLEITAAQKITRDDKAISVARGTTVIDLKSVK